MDCMKSIEEPCLTTLLKSIMSNTDICTILNEKENEGIKNREQTLKRFSTLRRLIKVYEREMKR